MWCISTVRVPSEYTFFSETASTLAFFGFLASVSFNSVLGVLSALSKNVSLFF